jgi:hypothetical protein
MGEISGSGSRMNNRIIFLRAYKTFFLVKIHKFFDVDPGSGMEKLGSGMEKSRIREQGETSRIRNTAKKLTFTCPI